MTLITFDYQGVFHDTSGTDIPELFDYIINPPINTRIAIVSLLSHQSVTYELTQRGVSLDSIQIFGYEDMRSKSEAIIELQDTWEPDKTLFVTDTVRDCEDVGRTNTIILAVTWGFSSIEDLQNTKVHAILDKSNALIAQINSLL